MKEIVVISGKGGTGKTSYTASLSVLVNQDTVVADCDVDAADMHLLLKPEIKHSEDFFSGVIADMNTDACTACGKCKEVCRFKAVDINDQGYSMNALNCEGCGYCARICPENAITMEEQNVGNWYISETKTGNTLVHAKLGIGAENSGKLVARVKNEAKRIAKEQNKSFIIVDGSPGIGCPVVSSLSGADYVIIVTEPSVSGIHDLKRVLELVEKFKIPTGVIINKYDINPHKTAEITKFLESESIDLITLFPYDKSYTEAMTQGKTIVEFDKNELKELVEQSWEKVKKKVNLI